ncbi:hypothetical protein Psi02_02300 [Planotetraspora silvatica]|uniref:Uncharacterized protein n=1 Tax=Planotetraspora silvatica TaxID=234614 RepID=A0A8J3XL53_9ACTN|nr:hypothetical protein Psi02_02300 [Planotetraspora silvatica]
MIGACRGRHVTGSDGGLRSSMTASHVTSDGAEDDIEDDAGDGLAGSARGLAGASRRLLHDHQLGFPS